MKQVTLGTQGLQVSAVGLGCMGMSEFYGSSDHQNSLDVLSKAIDLGCTFWDTSDMYGPYTNEKLLAKAIQGQRDDITLATKFGIVRNEAGEFSGLNGRPEYVRTSCDESLQRLNTDYIDLYYQHRYDPEVPIEETVGAMADLVTSGKVKYLGLSEATPELLRRANKEHPISALQTEYSLWSRDVEQEILPTVRELGIGFVAYSPLGRGFLSGTIKHDDLEAGDWRLDNPRFQKEAMQNNQRMVDAIERYAAQLNVSSAQISLAWLLAQGDDIALIPGTKKQHYLEQNWQSQDIEIPGNVLAGLDEVSALFEVEGSRY